MTECKKINYLYPGLAAAGGSGCVIMALVGYKYFWPFVYREENDFPVKKLIIYSLTAGLLFFLSAFLAEAVYVSSSGDSRDGAYFGILFGIGAGLFAVAVVVGEKLFSSGYKNELKKSQGGADFGGGFFESKEPDPSTTPPSEDLPQPLDLPAMPPGPPVLRRQNAARWVHGNVSGEIVPLQGDAVQESSGPERDVQRGSLTMKGKKTRQRRKKSKKKIRLNK